MTWVTVTSRDEAQTAVGAGADALVVHGPGAGGHRGIFNPGRRPADVALDELLAGTVGFDMPIVAAGGLSDAHAVADVLSHGAVAAQVGTALLR